MGFLRTDYSEVKTGFEVLPIGEYEAIISKVEVVTSSTGKPMVKVEMTIRDDVEQEGGKRKFFDNLVQQDNMMWKFQQVLKAVQVPEGTEIESLQDFAKAIQFKPVRFKNKHTVYEGEKQDKINFYTESKFGGDGDYEFTAGEGAGTSDDPFANTGQPIDISDDDLPF